MATSTRPRPRTRSRRSTTTAPTGAPLNYRQMRAVIALAIFLLFFCALWILSGDFTADYVYTLTGRGAEIGWSVQLVITVLEVAPAFLAPYLPPEAKRLTMVLWLLSLPFGTFGVLSSAVGVADYLAWTGAIGLVANVQNTIAAELIEFLPEPMIVFLFVALYRVLKAK